MLLKYMKHVENSIPSQCFNIFNQLVWRIFINVMLIYSVPFWSSQPQVMVCLFNLSNITIDDVIIFLANYAVNHNNTKLKIRLLEESPQFIKMKALEMFMELQPCKFKEEEKPSTRESYESLNHSKPIVGVWLSWEDTPNTFDDVLFLAYFAWNFLYCFCLIFSFKRKLNNHVWFFKICVQFSSNICFL